MRAERAGLDREVHGDRGGVPSGGSKPLEQGRLGGLVVEMHRLRIELGGEALDVRLGDPNFGGFELHSDGEIVEPLDLRHDFASQYDAPPRRGGTKGFSSNGI